jgi:hypothetical protein
MSGDAKRGNTSAQPSIRVRVSDVKARSQGLDAGAGDLGSVLIGTLGQAGRTGLVEAIARKVMSAASATPGARALTRREAADLARRIVDRLIEEAQGKRS